MIKLEQTFEETINDFSASVIRDENEKFQSGLESFDVYAAKIKFRIHDALLTFQQKFKRGYEALNAAVGGFSVVHGFSQVQLMFNSPRGLSRLRYRKRGCIGEMLPLFRYRNREALAPPGGKIKGAIRVLVVGKLGARYNLKTCRHSQKNSGWSSSSKRVWGRLAFQGNP